MKKIGLLIYKMVKNKLLLLSVIVLNAVGLAAKEVTVTSPDNHLSATIVLDEGVTYSVKYDGQILISPSEISMVLDDGTVYGRGKCAKISRRSVDESFHAAVYKRARVKDTFNEAVFSFKKHRLVVRAYNDCIAYRFISDSDKPFRVISEKADFVFPEDNTVYAAYSPDFYSSGEQYYSCVKISDFDTTKISLTPVMICLKDGKKINIMESALYNYPGLNVRRGDKQQSLTAAFALYPDEISQGGHNMLQGLVKSHKDYLAEFDAPTAFPWRIIAVSKEDTDMADSDIVYRLADAPAENSDWSWVKPGKVAWEWWNNWNLIDVDFVAGVNTETYKYYIDFASAYGLEYVILDEGWAVRNKADLMQVVPAIDLNEIVSYGREKNVGIILWAGYWAFDRNMEEVCRHYSEMGIKGFKIDFMDRDDQKMVEFYTKAAHTAAKYKMIVDFHGCSKPAGLNRTFPNVLNFEAVKGCEQMKWCKKETDQPLYDVLIPYIRMAAGPMDYTPGAMNNAAKSSFRPNYNEPMSMGTRCHQLAAYIVFDSPLAMLCDSPQNYEKEPECTKFIASIPTVWDETVPLSGEVGEYIVMVRQKDGFWYVGGITSWKKRDIKVDFSFLGDGQWIAEIFTDGINAHRNGRDYDRTVLTVSKETKMQFKLAPGGGFALSLHKKQ